ncbi:MAG: hypothetical protein ACXVHX_10230 [Solirubrobacteraceae bacterium]
MRKLRIKRTGVLTVIAVLLLAAGAYAAVIGLPADFSQVNNDPAAGIDPAQDAGESDVVGGSLAAGGRGCRGRRSSRSLAARSRASCGHSRTANG